MFSVFFSGHENIVTNSVFFLLGAFQPVRDEKRWRMEFDSF